jgi:8-oxo-dGTP pyrophosphatase MutT (NUDIX family)
MTARQKPRQAATVILLRAVEPKGFEAFLTRRPEGMAFLGGMYCFPGGTVRKEDCSTTMLRRCHGLTPQEARSIIGAHFAPSEALALWVAAIRELFEEVGILLAVNEKGERWRPEKNDPAQPAQEHAALIEKSLSFQALLENNGLFCDAASLSHFSYWQTPAQFSMRFDTRFFLAALPADQSPLPASPEVAHSVWLTPDRALQLFSKDELPMIFPTFASLRTLADYETLESVFREFRIGNVA